MKPEPIILTLSITICAIVTAVMIATWNPKPSPAQRQRNAWVQYIEAKDAAEKDWVGK